MNVELRIMNWIMRTQLSIRNSTFAIRNSTLIIHNSILPFSVADETANVVVQFIVL